jgi:hypothetical protein
VWVGTTIDFGSPATALRMEGGRLSVSGPGVLPPSGTLQFASGSFRFRSDQTLDGTAGFYTDFYGSPPVLGESSVELIIDGTTTLSMPLLLAGGALRTTRIVLAPGAGSVSLAAGALTLTGDGAVLDDGSDFGPDAVTVGDGAGAPAQLALRSPETVLLGAVMVLSDGALSFSGEALVADAVDNSGSLALTGATLRAESLVNNGTLRLIDAVIDADVTSPAGSTIDVAGTVVFNGSFSGNPVIRGSGTVIFNGPPAP